jgi:hypothetical protein
VTGGRIHQISETPRPLQDHPRCRPDEGPEACQHHLTVGASHLEWKLHFPRTAFRSDWNIVTRLYRGPLLVILLIGLHTLFLQFCLYSSLPGLLGLNVKGWGRAGVNHVLIFELDPRRHSSHLEVRPTCAGHSTRSPGPGAGGRPVSCLGRLPPTVPLRRPYRHPSIRQVRI